VRQQERLCPDRARIDETESYCSNHRDFLHEEKNGGPSRAAMVGMRDLKHHVVVSHPHRSNNRNHFPL
jgi:hypothetical protein